MLLRFLIDLLLLLSIFIIPWWACVFLSIFLIYFFKNYYEAIAIAFLIDFLHSAQTEAFFGFQFVVSLLVLILFIAMQYMKKEMIFKKIKK